MTSKFPQNKTWCSLLWDHLFVDPTGRVKPCCRFQGGNVPKEFNLNNAKLKDLFYSPWMEELRTKSKAGEPIEGCRRCYEEQESGKKSLRERYINNSDLPIEELVDMDQPKIRWVELAISNTCNLACRMCDSRYSSKWFDDEKAVLGRTLNDKKFSSMEISDLDPFLDDLVHIKFTGGEPLVIKDHYKLIDQLVERGQAKNIILNYSTNCTIKPKESLIESWKKFKTIEIALSFDAKGPSAEYIRYPEKTETIESTLDFFVELEKRMPNLSLGLRSTISLLNIYDYPETSDWWLQRKDDKFYNPTHLTHPEFLSATVLKKEQKQLVSEKLLNHDYKTPKAKAIAEYMVNFMNSSDDSHRLKELKNYIKILDERREQSFSKTYPYFQSLFSDV